MKLPTIALAIVLAGSLAGCGLGPSESSSPKTVVVATHDSWAMSKKVMADFERQSGYHVVIRPQGDAGSLTNKLILTKDAPIADATFGIDNTFASRAERAGIVDKLTPIDYGDVCANIDDGWFAKHHLAPPRTLDDLTKPAYKNLFVTEGATTSSTGLAFLLATIAAKGAQWPAYWKALMANGTKIDAGWENAYTVDFTAGGGKGSRPIVMSYASSPPYTIPKGGSKPTTSALLDTCFRQVEYAGVLKGAANAKGAADFVSFMRSREFQSQLPEQMYVYPIVKSTPLPPQWERWAPLSPKPFVISAAQIAQHRDAWLAQWRDIATG